ALDELRDMARLLVEHVGKVRGERVLRDSHVKAVGETRAVETMQGPKPVCPMLAQRFAAAPVDLVAGAARVCGADLEAGGENYTIDFVFDPVEDQPVRGDPIRAAPGGIDQRDVAAVESGEVLIVESGAFAELPIPGL